MAMPDLAEAVRERPVDVAMPPDGVFVLESHHASTFRMEPSTHDFLEVFHVLAGSGWFRIEGRSHRCRAGDVVAVPVGNVHWIEDLEGDSLSLYGICVAPDVWRHEPALPEHLPAGRLHVGGHQVPQVRSTLRRLLFEQTLGRAMGRAAVLGMTLELLAMLARSHAEAGPADVGADASPESRREAVRRYAEGLAREFFEPGDLDHASSRLGLSRRRFTQLFREVAGTSWSDYVTALRIDHARHLLDSTHRSVMAIAFECGYEDLSSFYRAFKSRVGLPPSEWRHVQRPQAAGGNGPPGHGAVADQAAL
ncbi:MAG TPA: AraC family transcriptional regulator [Isosphaeraceae bacterium]